MKLPWLVKIRTVSAPTLETLGLPEVLYPPHVAVGKRTTTPPAPPFFPPLAAGK